jgi:phospholipid/cholesterol/gamma-HCH transport system substrate-binding protein
LQGTPVKSDTVAVLVTQGVTGLTTVDLTGGTREAPLLTAEPGQLYPVIKSKPSLYARLESSISRLVAEDALPLLLGNLNEFTRDARVVVDDENRRALRKILADLAKITGTLEAHRGEINRAMRAAAQAAESFTEAGRKLEERLPQVFDQAATTFLAFQKASRDIARLAMVFEDAVKENRAGFSQFTGQTLADAGALVIELRDLTATLQRVAKELDEEPSALLFGRAHQPRGPGE